MSIQNNEFRFHKRIIKKYDIPIGLSDHTPSIFNALGAVSLGACIIEKHFAFDKKLPGPDHKSSISQSELKMLVEGTKANFLARGSLKKIFPEEKEIVSWARESVVTIKDIMPGEIFSYDNISTKRPSPKKTAVPANKFFKIIGTKAKKKILKENLIKYTNIK